MCFFAWCAASHECLSISGNAGHNESNIWHDGEMHISCPQGRRSPTACGDIFPGGNERYEGRWEGRQQWIDFLILTKHLDGNKKGKKNVDSQRQNGKENIYS